MLTQVPEIKTLLIIKIIVVFASIPVAIIGFKKRNKGLAVLSLLMIIGAYGMAEMSKKQKSSAAPTEVTHSAVMSGQEVYMSNCAKCHGDDGKAGVMGAKDLSQSALDINATIEIIKNGKGAMTPFEGMLSEGEISSVATYVETLKK